MSPWTRTTSPTDRPRPGPGRSAPRRRDRVGVNIESAHAILAGLDPSDEMGFALSFGKLWTVHLNDQNGLKFDEDKAFGSDRICVEPSTRCASSTSTTSGGAASGSVWTSRPCAPRRRPWPRAT